MKIRTSPRISVNKLGEYLLAAPARRQEIIRDQKFPPVFKSARYRVASAVVCDFLASGASDWSALTAAASSLRESVRFSKLKEADIALNIEALTCFMQFYGKVSLHGADVQVQKLPTASLSIGGVEVSISPSIQVRQANRRGGFDVGLLLPYFGKTYPIAPEAAEYIGALLLQYCQQELSTIGKPSHNICQVLDVFGGRLFKAPKAHVMRMKNVAAACEEIARAWPVTEPKYPARLLNVPERPSGGHKGGQLGLNPRAD